MKRVKENKKGCHPQGMGGPQGSGISLIGCIHKEKTLFNKNTKAGDSRLQPSAMTALFNNGFTLIELLVVVLIIGILAAVALPQYRKTVMKTRYMQLKISAENLKLAQMAFFLANGDYTEDLQNLDISLSGGQIDTSDSSKYVWPWGFCTATFDDNKHPQINIVCQNTDINLAYRLSMNPNKQVRDCYVYGSAKEEDFPIQNKVCQNETGLSAASSHASATPDYVRWRYN